MSFHNCVPPRRLMSIVPCRFNNSWLQHVSTFSVFLTSGQVQYCICPEKDRLPKPSIKRLGPWVSVWEFLKNRREHFSRITLAGVATLAPFGSHLEALCLRATPGMQFEIDSVNVSRSRPAAIKTWQWRYWYICFLFLSLILFSDLHNLRAAQGGERSEVCAPAHNALSQSSKQFHFEAKVQPHLLPTKSFIHHPFIIPLGLLLPWPVPAGGRQQGHTRRPVAISSQSHIMISYILLFKRTKLSHLRCTNRKGTQFFFFFHLTLDSVLFLVPFSSNGVSLLVHNAVVFLFLRVISRLDVTQHVICLWQACRAEMQWRKAKRTWSSLCQQLKIKANQNKDRARSTLEGCDSCWCVES